MLQTGEILKIGRISRCTSMDKLVREIKDAVVEAWHSPEALRTVESVPDVRTRVELALDPVLLMHLQCGEAKELVNELCVWMRQLNVEYRLGYTPQINKAIGQTAGHVIVVGIFMTNR